MKRDDSPNALSSADDAARLLEHLTRDRRSFNARARPSQIQTKHRAVSEGDNFAAYDTVARPAKATKVQGDPKNEPLVIIHQDSQTRQIDIPTEKVRKLSSIQLNLIALATFVLVVATFAFAWTSHHNEDAPPPIQAPIAIAPLPAPLPPPSAIVESKIEPLAPAPKPIPQPPKRTRAASSPRASASPPDFEFIRAAP